MVFLMDIDQILTDLNSIPFPPPPNNSSYPIYTSDALHQLSPTTRHVFYWLILFTSVLAIIGNVLAIRSIVERKTKFLQKSCILALAISDILTVILFCVNVLGMLSKEIIVWSFGEFFCYFIPFAQVFATTSSSLLLMVIALDRYQNVVQTFSEKRWDPQPRSCVLIVLGLFAVCGVIAAPMYTSYEYQKIWIIMLPLKDPPIYELQVLCYASNKTNLSKYYVGLDGLIFLPMTSTFIWFYVKIAVLIWKHRKPVTSKNKYNKDQEDSTTSTKMTNVASSTVSVISQNKPKKNKNLQLQRKIRTFRIVLVLIISFVLCRFPYWCYYTIRLLGKCTSATSWNLLFSLVALNLLNCVLNPLLYTFLNQTITAIRMIKEFIWKICCCCCSGDEFETFEKENPFSPRACDPRECACDGKNHTDKKNNLPQKF